MTRPTRPLPLDVTRRGVLAGGLALVAGGCTRTRPAAAPAAATAAPTRSAPEPRTPRLRRPSSPDTSAAATSAPPSTAPPSTAPADVASILRRATVPVLCWHQLRDWRADDGAYSRRLLICPPSAFRAQLDALAAGGWTTIGPDQYLAHLEAGAQLPDKPILLTFDDAQATQATEGLPQLVQRGMTATFFAMTVVLGKEGWLSQDDLRHLDGAGMTVAAHTYDHHRVDRYSAPDWALQLEQPRELLERVVAKPVTHFAFPYGVWDAAALPHLEAAGYRTAYQLSDRPTDPAAPLQTLQRILVDSTWTGPQLLAQLNG